MSHIFLEKRIQGFLNGKFLDVTKDANLITTEDIYNEAIKFYNVPDKCDKNSLSNLRRDYLLSYHPDKNGNSLESHEMFIKYENAFNVIKTHRKQRGDWY